MATAASTALTNPDAVLDEMIGREHDQHVVRVGEHGSGDDRRCRVSADRFDDDGLDIDSDRRHRTLHRVKMLGSGEDERPGDIGETVESGEGRFEQRSTEKVQELLWIRLGGQGPKPGPCAPGEDYRSDS